MDRLALRLDFKNDSTHKLLCFSMIGRLPNAEVSSASAIRALNRSMKNRTPPRGKTPAEVAGML